MSGQERREQLIDVGRSIFAQKGFQATSIEEIALRAKITKPLVYEHFGGKEGLYAVVVDREVKALLDRITDGLDAEQPEAHLVNVAWNGLGKQARHRPRACDHSRSEEVEQEIRAGYWFVVSPITARLMPQSTSPITSRIPALKNTAASVWVIRARQVMTPSTGSAVGAVKCS